MRPDEEVIKRWRGSAPFWDKRRNIIRGMFAPVASSYRGCSDLCPGHKTDSQVLISEVIA
jgi:hypothetical protein